MLVLLKYFACTCFGRSSLEIHLFGTGILLLSFPAPEKQDTLATPIFTEALRSPTVLSVVSVVLSVEAAYIAVRVVSVPLSPPFALRHTAGTIDHEGAFCFKSFNNRMHVVSASAPPLVFRYYTSFCGRTFGQGFELEHREIDASQPVLYKNTICAYEHFFGTPLPAILWPGSPYRVNGEEGPFGRRLAFVRLPGEKYDFVKEC